MISTHFDSYWVDTEGGPIVLIPGSMHDWNKSKVDTYLCASLQEELDSDWLAAEDTQWYKNKKEELYGITDYWDTCKSQSLISVAQRNDSQYIILGSHPPRLAKPLMLNSIFHIVQLWGGFDNPDFNSVGKGLRLIEAGRAHWQKKGPSLPVLLLDEEYFLMDANEREESLSATRFSGALNDSPVFKCRPGVGPHLIETYFWQFDDYASYIAYAFTPFTSKSPV